ncbi:hypothetical protein NCAS_0B05940 [Naumovozyma castellii]|uniref:Uncharacterized protein n=1 Tax=Naumovozyma castellii TaxID=27288 RepID=G0V9R1_NAUCA|nr:hypothetical protein NCAS_0B05940 [Naumovozyma castellii CBS 4309]CCC68678.1 hypothetical protein NCAS_0B05940 [Naumovozyma castellii CBS 4309]
MTNPYFLQQQRQQQQMAMAAAAANANRKQQTTSRSGSGSQLQTQSTPHQHHARNKNLKPEGNVLPPNRIPSPYNMDRASVQQQYMEMMKNIMQSNNHSHDSPVPQELPHSATQQSNTDPSTTNISPDELFTLGMMNQHDLSLPLNFPPNEKDENT